MAPVLSLAEALDHPHNRARDSYGRVGEADLARPAPRFSATPGALRDLTAMDADTATVLDELGFTDADREQLRRDGAIV